MLNEFLVENLACVQDIIRIKGLLDAAHQLKVRFFKHDVHVSLLDKPHSMLAADRATEVLHWFEERTQALVHFGIAVTVRCSFFLYPDVKVSITRVAVAYRVKSVLKSEFLHTLDESGKFGAWHHGIFFDRVSIDLNCLGGAPAKFPELGLLLCIVCEEDFATFVFVHKCSDLFHFLHQQVGIVSIYFDDEVRRDVIGHRHHMTIYHLTNDLQRVDLHEFESAWCETRTEYRAHGLASLLQGFEWHEHQQIMLRKRN